MKKRIILKRLLLSTAVLTVASTAIIVQQYNSADKTVKTEECSKQDVVSNSAEPKIEKSAVSKPVEEAKVEQPVFSKPVQEAKAEQPVVTKPVEEAKAESPVLTTPVEQPKAETSVEQTKPVEATTPKVEESVVSEKGEALVQPTLPEFHDAKGQPEVQPALTELIVPAENPQPEQPTAKVEEKIVSEKGEPLVQPELPEYHAENGTPEVQPELPEFQESKGQPEVQPALPEFVVPTENTQPEQPVVPEAPIVTEKGEPLVQPELPEYHAENGTPEVQPELPEFQESKGQPEVQPALPEFVVPTENTQPEQPVVPEAPIVTEKGEPLVQPELPEFHAENGTPEVQPELPEFQESKGQPEVQPALPEFVVPTENTQPEQPVVPEAPIVTEKGEPLVQPELPEFHAENGTPEVQPELPEFHAENGDALVQPELPEFHSENGTPEVQPELPEFHAETGDALVQPELPEYHESKGEPEVQPALPEFKLKTVSREETIKIPAVTMNVPNSELNEGETEIVTQPKDGSITRTYEDVLDEHDNVLSTKLVNETRVEAIKGVTSIGTKPVKKVFGETGMYRFSEHLSDENILEFREDVKLTADEIHALGQDEINKRAEQNLENTITVQDKQRQNLSHMDSAPLSDETINNLNGDTYINHKNIGLKVLELVNAERKRLGVHELTWSDPLYTLAKVRANEVRENGSIRFYTEDGQTLKHVRDDKGTPWYTIRDNTEFEDSALGENLAGYSIRPNVYKAFSENYIADQLYNQWKNSPHHYANMIKEKFYQFAFDVAYSKFWRDGHTDVTYKKQGVLGVQLFADEGY